MTDARLLSAVYDGERQPHFVSIDEQDKRFDLVLGRMRLDAMLYDRVVCVDGDIFDGTFFLSAAHRGRLVELPWRYLEVRLRTPKIEDAFVQQVRRRPADPKLAPYIMSSLEPKYAVHIAKNLEQIAAQTVTDLPSAAAALVSAGLNPSMGAWYLYAWQKLAEFIALSPPDMRPVWTSDSFDIEPHLAIAREGVQQNLETGMGKMLWSKIRTLNSRNKVAAALDAPGRTPSWEEERDIATMRTWYNQAYKRAQQAQHQCTIVETLPSDGCRNFAPNYFPIDEPSTGAENCSVPAYFLQALGKLPIEDFNSLREFRGFRRCVTAWKEDGEQSALSDGIGIVLRSLDHTGLEIKQPFTPAARVATELIAAGAGAVSVDACLHSLTKRRFLHGAATTIGAVAAGGMAEHAFVESTRLSIDLLGPQREITNGIVQMEEGRRSRQ